MSKSGFILLLVGAVLQTIRGVQLVIDPLSGLIEWIFSQLQIPIQFQNLLVNMVLFTSSITGIIILIGALLWFGFSYGPAAIGGKIMVIISVVFGIIAIVIQVYYLLIGGIFFLLLSNPTLAIGLIIGLGINSAGIILALVGLKIGAAREERPEREDFL